MTSIKSKGQFDQVTSAHDKKYLVNFWASWAPACEDMNIAFDTLALEHSQLEFLKVEAEVVPEVTMEYGVEAVPCFLLLKVCFIKGKMVMRDGGKREREIY